MSSVEFMNELARLKDKKKKVSKDIAGMKSYEEIITYLTMNK